MFDSDYETSSIAILMCTYNGEKYLEEQLQSFEKQSFKNWTLYISDDGSKDATFDILNSYKTKWQGLYGREKLIISHGPRQGFAQNFLSITSDSTIQANYYAYSDQDDIWLEDKLARAVNNLAKLDNNIPLLYSSRTKLINENHEDLGLSPLYTKPPSFKNALVQNIAGGNTMVFNENLRSIIVAGHSNSTIHFHDWWLYLVATASGGEVIYDQQPSLLYRQHSNNLIGSKSGIRENFNRLKRIFFGKFKSNTDQNIAALSDIKIYLTPSNFQILENYKEARKALLFKKIYLLIRLGIYRQTHIGQLSLMIAAIFNRI
ncbi:glycosyltransferase family 2 protein [Aquirhabdus parva]|uniref:Glycosyltransferase family 2 protein n=1 Tax=Aquirhabdus parva TaxID=2283318 RepID=A0A345PAF1_9GAMM|nr:glycosyltransferase family 2 protein [Aquirhabdus parva]AXI04260.1 glycosyltransferase family 2 protein [Aquirhabdus parva]